MLHSPRAMLMYERRDDRTSTHVQIHGLWCGLRAGARCREDNVQRARETKCAEANT